MVILFDLIGFHDGLLWPSEKERAPILPQLESFASFLALFFGCYVVCLWYVIFWYSESIDFIFEGGTWDKTRARISNEEGEE